MKFLYKNTKEDYVEFNFVVNSETKAGKRNLFVNRMIMVSLFIILAMIGIFLNTEGIHLFRIYDLIFYALFALLAIIWFIYYPKILKYVMSRNLEKMSKQGTMPYDVELSIEFLADRIQEKSDNSQTTLLYSDVYKIIKTERLIIIMNGVMSGLLVPIRCLNGSESTIMELLRDKGCKIDEKK